MASAVSSALLLCSLASLSSAYVLVHQPPVVYTSANPPPVVPVDRPPLFGGPGQPSVVYHYGLGGVRPQLQPPVVLVRVVPVLPPQLPPQQPPFIEEVPPVFKNPPTPDAGAAKPPAKKPTSRRGHGANCPEVDNKKGIAPPPTRKPSKRGRETQARRKSRRPPETTTRRPPSKANRRVDPKSERLRSERLTAAKNA
ncbi:hypothetical protein V5799_009416 [Amblyomma americanum]|uniref:Secreted protein n=1 Tax=Amblyomma americanum TaxID=6943 RepID=A0AAQ4FAU6_AMBAM